MIVNILNSVLLLVTLKLLFKMSKEIDNLKVQVQKDTDATSSAITLLNGLKSQLDAAIANNDMSQVQDLSDQIGSSADSLAAAVTANTAAAGPGTANTAGV